MRSPATSAPIAVVGDLNVDLLLTVPAVPGPGGDAIASAQRTLLGGSSTNTAVALARLGRRVRLVARHGADPQGDYACSVLAAEGIATDRLRIDPREPTATNVVVITPDGERTMYAYRGANARLSPADLEPSLLSGAAALHLSGYLLLTADGQAAVRSLVDSACSAGVPVALDIPVAPAEQAAEHILGLLPRIDLLVVGEAEARTLTGRPDTALAVHDLTRRTRGRVAVKGGAQGSTLYQGSSATHVPACPVVVVDTTGAGDAFAAGLLHALFGAGLDDRKALVLANTLGALATTRTGAGQQLPKREEIVYALRSRWTGPSADAARAALSTVAASEVAAPKVAAPEGER